MQGNALYNDCGGERVSFPQRTIYESLLDAGHDFRIFYNGSITEGGVPGDIYMGGLLKHLAGRAHTFDAKDSGFFDAETLKGVEIPMLFMAGSDDATSLYEEGVADVAGGLGASGSIEHTDGSFILTVPADPSRSP
mgnify:CR=1 FL=1